jgi:hypothetical protein
MGRQRFFPTGELPPDTRPRFVPEYTATDTIKTLLPACVALVVDVWSNADDCKVISAIDRDGVDLLDDYSLGSDGETIICHAMMHDIDQWIRAEKLPDLRGYYPSEYRIWQWTQAHNIKPLGPFQPYQYYEKV